MRRSKTIYLSLTALFLSIVISGLTSCQSATEDLAPTISDISPTGKLANTPDFEFTVNGSEFDQGSQIIFNGQPMPTTLVSTEQLTCSVPRSHIQLNPPYPPFTLPLIDQIPNRSAPLKSRHF